MHILPPTLAKARARLVVHAPFYGSMALGLRWQEDTTLPTMATDGRAIFYNRAWCDEIGSDKCMGVIAHEVLHVVNKHHLRRGERDPKLWNIAADLVINTILQAAGYPLPEGGVFDTQGEFAGLWVETVYARLETRAGRQQDGSNSPSPAQGGSGAGAASGLAQTPSVTSGSASVPGDQPGADDAAESVAGFPVPGWGEVRDLRAESGRALSTPERAQAEAEIDVQIRQALAAAKRAGRLPASLKEMVEAASPRTDWRDRFRLLADGLIRDGITWSRPNRRFLPHGLYLPAADKAGPGALAVVLDTSGSITAAELAAYTGDLLGLIDEMQPEEVILVQCDVTVRHVAYLQQGETPDRIEVMGRGGTLFQPAFDWIAENAPHVRAIIYETDLDAADQPADPGIPVIWLTPTRGHRMPFGEIIEIQL